MKTRRLSLALCILAGALLAVLAFAAEPAVDSDNGIIDQELIKKPAQQAAVLAMREPHISHPP